MNEAAWALILANLDEALDKRQPEERVGVLVGWGVPVCLCAAQARKRQQFT